jgi:hypothetical protein
MISSAKAPGKEKKKDSRRKKWEEVEKERRKEREIAVVKRGTGGLHGVVRR